MSYYKDLTPYNYHHHSTKELNVGWLELGQDFDTGDVPEGFLENLKLYENNRVFQTRGWHSCQFCEDKKSGSYEIRVISNSGVYYACPVLIIHYIEEHKYLPPQEFIEAVMNGPKPGSEEYKYWITLMPTHWERRIPDPNDEDYQEKMRNALVSELSDNINSQILNELLEENPGLNELMVNYPKIISISPESRSDKTDKEEKS